MTSDEAVFETADEAVAAAWGAIELALVRGYEDWACEQGASEACIARTRDLFVKQLRQAWASRSETARLMLEAHATNLQ